MGNTARTTQGVGWVPIHPVDIDLPLWMGTWLGVYPTVETLGAQLLAFCFVIGSYFAAEWIRKRDLRRAIVAQEESLQRANAESQDGGHGNGSGDRRRALGSAGNAVKAPPHSLSRS